MALPVVAYGGETAFDKEEAVTVTGIKGGVFMERQLKLVIASDLSGYDLKTEMVERLGRKGYSITDFGCDSAQEGEYPVYAKKVGEAIASGAFDRGILICGTGQGMMMAANKVKGIRAALCYDVLPAILTREHNDSNILATGSWLVDGEQLERIIEVWLFGKFTNLPRHRQRIQMMCEMDQER